jgi:hypothetical protein
MKAGSSRNDLIDVPTTLSVAFSAASTQTAIVCATILLAGLSSVILLPSLSVIVTGYVGKTPLDAPCVVAVGLAVMGVELGTPAVEAVMGMEFVALAVDVDAVFTEPGG